MDIFYEQVSQDKLRSFFFRRGFFPEDMRLLYHQHPEYEITIIHRGMGQRITGNCIESFNEGEIVIVPSNLPHCWQYDASLRGQDKEKESSYWQFSPEFLSRTAYAYPEFQPIASFYKDLRQSIEVLGETAKRIHALLDSFSRQTEPEQLLSLLKALYLVAHSRECRYIGQGEYTSNLPPRNRQKLHAIYKYMVEHYQQKITLDEISLCVGMNKTAFCLFFRKATGESFTNYLNQFRLRMARSLLCSTDRNIAEICYAVGFSDVPYFNRVFKRYYGMAPGKMRESYEFRVFGGKRFGTHNS